MPSRLANLPTSILERRIARIIARIGEAGANGSYLMDMREHQTLRRILEKRRAAAAQAQEAA